MEPRLSQPRDQCFLGFGTHKNHLKHLLHTDSQTPPSVMLTISMSWWEPVFSISNKLPGDTAAAGPGTVLAVVARPTLLTTGCEPFSHLHLPTSLLSFLQQRGRQPYLILWLCKPKSHPGWFSSESSRLKFCIAFIFVWVGRGRERWSRIYFFVFQVIAPSKHTLYPIHHLAECKAGQLRIGRAPVGTVAQLSCLPSRYGLLQHY